MLWAAPRSCLHTPNRPRRRGIELALPANHRPEAGNWASQGISLGWLLPVGYSHEDNFPGVERPSRNVRACIFSQTRLWIHNHSPVRARCHSLVYENTASCDFQSRCPRHFSSYGFGGDQDSGLPLNAPRGKIISFASLKRALVVDWLAPPVNRTMASV